MKFATLFAQTAIAASFDNLVCKDAADGRINRQFLSLLDTCYGLTMPASPKAFVPAVNAMRMADKMPRIVPGNGAVKNSKAVHVALAELCAALIDGKAQGLPDLAPMPAWLIDKPKAPKATTAPGNDDADDDTDDDAPQGTTTADAPTAGAELLSQANDALIKVLALLKAGAYDSEQRAALYTALEQSSAAPVEADAKAARKPRRKTTAEKQDKATA